MSELDHAWATIPRDPRPTGPRPRTVEHPAPGTGAGASDPLDPPAWLVWASLTAGATTAALLVCAWFNLLPGTR